MPLAQRMASFECTGCVMVWLVISVDEQFDESYFRSRPFGDLEPEVEA